MSKLMSSLLAVAVAGAFSMSAIAAEHGTAAPGAMATSATSTAPAAEKPAEAPKKASKKTHKAEEKKAGASTSEAPAKK